MINVHEFLLVKIEELDNGCQSNIEKEEVHF